MAMKHGGHQETDKLRANLQDQLSRLLTQLKDLEDLKEDLDEEEYAHTKAETVQQLQEFEQSLARLAGGNTTLMDEISSMKLALRTAISEAFQTPEVIKLFTLGQPQLRERLETIQLNEAEKNFLQSRSTLSMAAFEAIRVDEGQSFWRPVGKKSDMLDPSTISGRRGSNSMSLVWSEPTLSGGYLVRRHA